jgi:hypothetical protein
VADGQQHVLRTIQVVLLCWKHSWVDARRAKSLTAQAVDALQLVGVEACNLMKALGVMRQILSDIQ